MLAHQSRMLDEQMQLEDRINKLRQFINGNPIFGTLSEDERNDQIEQLEAMQKYTECLDRRIKRAGLKK